MGGWDLYDYHALVLYNIISVLKILLLPNYLKFNVILIIWTTLPYHQHSYEIKIILKSSAEVFISSNKMNNIDLHNHYLMSQIHPTYILGEFCAFM